MINSLSLLASTVADAPSGIINNDMALPYVYLSYGVTALVLVGLGVYLYRQLKSSSAESERLNPRKKNRSSE